MTGSDSIVVVSGPKTIKRRKLNEKCQCLFFGDLAITYILRLATTSRITRSSGRLGTGSAEAGPSSSGNKPTAVSRTKEPLFLPGSSPIGEPQSVSTPRRYTISPSRRAATPGPAPKSRSPTPSGYAPLPGIEDPWQGSLPDLGLDL